MVEERLLIWKFKCGSRDALREIYEKYRGYLLTLATALLSDVNSAEDVVHDFFVSFAQSGRKLKLDGSEEVGRLTFFTDYPGFKATNPVISPDGKTMAFQTAKFGDPAGFGRGILLYHF